MKAEEWLADLEAKADASIAVKDSTNHVERAVKGITFANVANPASVKRLVSMVRFLAESTVDAHGSTPQGFHIKPAVKAGYAITNKKADAIMAWCEHSYQQTEPTP